jgi:hypothetical protein
MWCADIIGIELDFDEYFKYSLYTIDKLKNDTKELMFDTNKNIDIELERVKIKLFDE